MSDTLVIHPKDESTVMLNYVYEGKGFDVINDPNISRIDLINAIKSHKRIIMLGHGGPQGLCHPDMIRYGYVRNGNRPFIIDDSLAYLLKTKETISMWCFSDQYFIRNNIPGFHTGMIISEVNESLLMLGYCPLSEKELFDNMIELSNALGDAIDLPTLEIKNHILEVYNHEDAITQFNRKNIKVI